MKKSSVIVLLLMFLSGCKAEKQAKDIKYCLSVGATYWVNLAGVVQCKPTTSERQR